jgi:hypothetical protein
MKMKLLTLFFVILVTSFITKETWSIYSIDSSIDVSNLKNVEYYEEFDNSAVIDSAATATSNEEQSTFYPTTYLIRKSPNKNKLVYYDGLLSASLMKDTILINPCFHGSSQINDRNECFTILIVKDKFMVFHSQILDETEIARDGQLLTKVKNYNIKKQNLVLKSKPKFKKNEIINGILEIESEFNSKIQFSCKIE